MHRNGGLCYIHGVRPDCPPTPRGGGNLKRRSSSTGRRVIITPAPWPSPRDFGLATLECLVLSNRKGSASLHLHRKEQQWNQSRRLVRPVFITPSSESQLILLQASGKEWDLGSTDTRHAKTVDCGRLSTSAGPTHRARAILKCKEPMVQAAGYAAEIMSKQTMTHTHGCVIEG